MHLQHLPDERVVGCSLLRTYRECARATLAHDFTRSKELENFLTSIVWEKLNTGHYGEVDEAWRVFYASVMMCKAVRLKFEEQIQVNIFAFALIVLVLIYIQRCRTPILFSKATSLLKFSVIEVY